jgi:DNA-binding FrmR family transcriptional regulator
MYFAMTEHTRATHLKIIKRLKRADGHLLSLIDMIETGRGW